MNFKVVEGKYLDEYEEDFIRLYNNRRVKTRDIPPKLEISESNYCSLRKKLLSENKIIDRAKKHKKTVIKNPSNIYEVRRGKRTYYFVKRKEGYYGCYKNREEAKEVVKRLKECNWDISQLKKIRREVLKQ